MCSYRPKFDLFYRYCDLEIEVNVTKDLPVPTVNRYLFDKNASIGSRDSIEYIEVKVSKLMQIHSFSERNRLDKMIHNKG